MTKIFTIYLTHDRLLCAYLSVAYTYDVGQFLSKSNNTALLINVFLLMPLV